MSLQRALGFESPAASTFRPRNLQKSNSSREGSFNSSRHSSSSRLSPRNPDPGSMVSGVDESNY